MTHHLNLEVQAAEGVLVRVLGLTERRGYRPLSIHAEPRGEGFALDLTVYSDRPIELLIRQLAKLLDVRRVALALSEAAEVAR